MAERRLHIGVDAREMLGQPTGVGRYLREVLRCWVTDPVFPHALTAFLPAAVPPDLQTALPGVTWDVSATTHGGTWWEQRHLPRALSQTGADVLFAVGYTAPLRCPVPFVVVVHDVSFFAHPEWFRPRERLRRQWLTRSSARRAATVLTVSEFSRQEIARWLGVASDRIRLAPPAAPTPDRTSFDVPRDPIVLFVGSLLNRRNIPLLIRGFALAHARVPAARLILVGDNRTAPRIDPVAVASAAGVSAAVEWRNYVSEGDLDALYRHARVCAFLSDYEGFGMTPFEAIARGVPAVLLETAVTREVYGDGARLVASTPDAVGEALTRLLTDDRAHQALTLAGLTALSRYAWPRTAEVVRHALEEAARR